MKRHASLFPPFCWYMQLPRTAFLHTECFQKTTLPSTCGTDLANWIARKVLVEEPYIWVISDAALMTSSFVLYWFSVNMNRGSTPYCMTLTWDQNQSCPSKNKTSTSHIIMSQVPSQWGRWAWMFIPVCSSDQCQVTVLISGETCSSAPMDKCCWNHPRQSRCPLVPRMLEK